MILNDVMLLKVGRHIRPKNNFKVIVAREDGEARFMQGYKNEMISIYPSSHNGALALIDGEFKTQQELETALSLIARYSQGKNEPLVTLSVRQIDSSEQQYEIQPMDADNINKEWII